MNPVGPLWLLLSLPVLALLARPALGGAPMSWTLRWGLAVGSALVAVLPSLYAIGRGPGSAGLAAPGGGAAVATGESAAQFVSFVDPFLFGPADQSLSPFPLLRAELAILLIVGVLLLVFGRGRFALAPEVRRFFLAGGSVAVILLAIGALAYASIGPFPTLFRVTSAEELSILLFVLYALLAGVPLAVAVRELANSDGLGRPASERALRWRAPGPAAFAAIAVVLIVAPGVAVTAGQLPAQLHQGYSTFSNLTRADVDLLEWAPSHLPAGSRVLVGPGSAAGFLPAYDPQLAVLFPMTVGFLHGDPDYWALVDGLQNGSYNRSAFSSVYFANGGPEHLFYVAVTENNTALFRPMEPAPLLAQPFPVVFQEGGVYLFEAFPTPAPLGAIASAELR